MDKYEKAIKLIDEMIEENAKWMAKLLDVKEEIIDWDMKHDEEIENEVNSLIENQND